MTLPWPPAVHEFPNCPPPQRWLHLSTPLSSPFLFLSSSSQCCSQYRLVLGAHQLLNPSPNQILVNVKQIILHPHYNKKTKIADIALVRLEKPVKSTKFIRPISLPGAFRKFPEKMKCWVTGWGKVEMTSKCQKSQRGTGSP